MQVGDKVWIFDSNNRIYHDENGNITNYCWFRGYFVEKYILGETKQSWIIGNKNWDADNRNNIKVNKKTLTYKIEYGKDGILYTSEQEIDEKCWIRENQSRLKDLVGYCKDYTKLRKIEEILNS